MLLLCASLALVACGSVPDMAPVASNDAGIPNTPDNLKPVHAPPPASTFSADKGEGHQALDATLAWGTANYLQVKRFKKWVAKLQGGKAASTGVPR